MHNLNPSGQEIKALMVNSFHKKISSDYIEYHHCPQHLCSLLYKLRLNSWNTKYCKNVRCACNNMISVEHVLFECPVLLDLYKEHNLTLDNDMKDVTEFLSNKNVFLFNYLTVIFQSAVYDKL